MVASALASIPRMARRYAWRTPRLPELVNTDGACEILGVDKMTLWRWQQPDSGVGTESKHPPDNTYLIPPIRALGRGGEKKQPLWTKDDLIVFRDLHGRQRQPSGQAQPRAANDGAARRPQPA
jgi:hypothetical protein